VLYLLLIYNFNILLFLVFNFNDERDGDHNLQYVFHWRLFLLNGLEMKMLELTLDMESASWFVFLVCHSTNFVDEYIHSVGPIAQSV
jgi:hypothetical protein